MHFSTKVAILSSLLSTTLAVPAIPSSFPPGAAVLSRNEVHELGRLARIVNAAHCPSHRHLQPPSHLSTALSSHRTQGAQKRSQKKQYLKSGLEKGSNILGSSHDLRGKATDAEEEDFEEVEWFIAHTPESRTLTVSLSSLPFTDTYLALLMSTPQGSNGFFGKQSQLVPLPELLFPERLLSAYFPAGVPRPMIHHALAEEAEYVGAGLVLRLLEMMEQSEQSQEEAMATIEKLEIVGHGLGANVGLLVALSVHLHLQDPVRNIQVTDVSGQKPLGPASGSATASRIAMIVGQLAANAWSAGAKRDSTVHHVKHSKRDQIKKEKAAKSTGVEIDIHLFGMSRVGDVAFAKWVDELALGQGLPSASGSAVAAPSNGGKILGSYPLLSEPTPSSASVSHIHITRVSSFADPIPHLPSIATGFTHFRAGEVWVDGDPRTVWDCDARRIGEAASASTDVVSKTATASYEFEGCANGVQMDKTSLLDHAGPYGGVWIGVSSCE